MPGSTPAPERSKQMNLGAGLLRIGWVFGHTPGSKTENSVTAYYFVQILNVNLLENTLLLHF